MGDMSITSRAFGWGEAIPVKHTCDDADLSPSLIWKDLPEGVQRLALIAEDPDAPRGNWVHWVIYNIPAESKGLPEGVPGDPELDDGSLQGRNDFGKLGYGGPCPPPGKAHRYYFRLYALDNISSHSPGISKGELEKAMKGHILARAEHMGTYGRLKL